MVSDFPHNIVEDLIKTNWTLPDVATELIDWGYYPESVGQTKQYTIKCEDMADSSRDVFGVPISHEFVENGVGVVIGVRDPAADKTRPPTVYIKMLNHVKQIIKTSRFPANDIHEFRLGQGSREIENRMIANTRWYIYYLTVQAWYWD